MIGAIAGDIIGSAYEFDGIKTKDFPLFQPRSTFTDDTVLTVAVAEAILTDGDYFKAIKRIGRMYPGAGYGTHFRYWLFSDETRPYNSWGNGSAMRVSAVGFAFDTQDRVLEEARNTAKISHNHPEGIKGAQATALAIFLARTGHDKANIKQAIHERFRYYLDESLDEIRPRYHFDESCPGTVPQAVVAFLESTSYEDAIRNAISLGGDSDTLACITGGMAQAFYGTVPEHITLKVKEILTEDLWEITEMFCSRYGVETGL